VAGPLLAGIVGGLLATIVAGAAMAAAGPPFPAPEAGVVVYDTAKVFEPATIRRATATIVAIEERTGAEIVVYTQVKPDADTVEEAEADARALMDQWGVGRRGFDDGLVILFDLDRSFVHGQVQLFAGPGYQAAFLSDAERQKIFEEQMLPELRAGDLDGALLAALRAVDAAATPDHARRLELARQFDAALGLFVAPLVFALLVGWALISWLRFGRDPVYLDSPSILMPAPPPELSAAGGALISDGRSSRRTLTTALLDLASRGALRFEEEAEKRKKAKVGIELLDASTVDEPGVDRARRRPIGAAEEFLLRTLHGLPGGSSRRLTSEELEALSTKTSEFNERLESHHVERGWFRERPTVATMRWLVIAISEIVVGALLVWFVGQGLPSGGVTMVGIATVLAGIVTLVVARAMPARTMAGAMLRAMLAAYRRTLQKTLAQARSMRTVVDSRVVPWLETPDQVVVWGVALGLHDEVQKVLERSLEDLREGRATTTQAWLPAWYGGSGSTSAGSGSGGAFGLAPGLMSSSGGLPNLGGMVAAIGTIGVAASSNGDGGGFGGGGGGGGGGAGGGF
jgi:uncharacterized membrane protein YgcG